MRVTASKEWKRKVSTRGVVLVAGAHARIESRTKFTVLRKFFRYEEGV